MELSKGGEPCALLFLIRVIVYGQGNLFSTLSLLYTDMRSRTILALALFLLSGLLHPGCELIDRHQYCDPYDSGELTLNDTLELKYNQLYCNSKYEFRLSFDSLSDGRCPIGAWCIWEGTARVNLIVQPSGKAKQTFTLFTHKGFLNDTLLDGIRYEFIDLFPYPEIDRNYREEDYILRFLISD